MARHRNDDDGYDREEMFADPGGRSALRAASKDNPRNLPCPNCGAPNRLTPADRARGYQCDACADALGARWAMTQALRDLVEAAEAAGWDIGENAGILQRARDELATLEPDGPPSLCTGECRGKSREEHWDFGGSESEAIVCRFCGEDGCA